MHLGPADHDRHQGRVQRPSFREPRWYDASMGRYTQPDPIGMPDGPSRYAYSLNSPLMYVDPEGRFAWIVARIAGGFVGGFAFDAAFQYATSSCVDWGDAALRGGLTGGGFAAPHWWFSARSAGGGVWTNGPGVDWHRFKLKGRWVNRPHIEPGGRAGRGHHWPWN